MSLGLLAKDSALTRLDAGGVEEKQLLLCDGNPAMVTLA